MHNYLMINSKNNFLVGIALKDFDILMNEVIFLKNYFKSQKRNKKILLKR